MKLKEKLAEKYAVDPLEKSFEIEKNAFLAGFEKAREMAAKLAFAFDDHTVANQIETLAEHEV